MYVQIENIFKLQKTPNNSMKSQPFKPNLSKINEQSKHRSLVDNNKEQILQTSHSEINFVNTELNEIYQINIQVRNVTQNSLKIKIKKPSSPLLAVHISKEGQLAAGLELKITIVYDSKDSQIIRDKIVIMTDINEIELPINVYPQVNKLQFEPFLNLGFARSGSTIQANWEMANHSDTNAHIKLTPLLAEQTAKLTLSQDQFVLQPSQKKKIKIFLFSSAIGTIQGCIEILPKTLGYNTLQFVANFCDFTRMISTSKGQEISQISLEPMFGGESAQVQAFLVNNTPQKCEFRVTRKKGANGQQTISLVTPQQIGRDDSEKLVQYWPTQGDLQAYSSIPLRAIILAKYDEQDLQVFCNYILGKHQASSFQKEWNYNLRTYLNHEDQHLDLNIKGISLIPKICITPTYLNFAVCPLQQKIRKSIKIDNFSPKSVTLDFQNSANYIFSPQKVKLQSNSSTTLEVIFHPKKIGQLNEICCAAVGIFSFPLKFFGKCSFVSNPNQKQEQTGLECQQIAIQNLQKSSLEEQISAIHKSKISPSNSFDNSKNAIHFDTYRHNQTSNSPVENNFSGQCYKRTRVLRSKNGKQVKLDLNHLNPNLPVDIYPSAAKNQQEQRLIARELTSHELRNIPVGPVIIEMGTIFLRSTQRRSFHICNFNPKPISIRLEAPHESFAETLDEKQIIPGESHGGFNIVFEPLTQGPFKHTLQYVLNSNHFFQLMITGTCILPLLTLSRNDIKFMITEDDKKFQKKEVLKLDNNYEYDIQYEWKSPTNSQFTIQPTSGIIKANSSVQTTILLNFQSLCEGMKVEQHLKLKIKHGKMLEVKCSAVIPESNCICKSQQLKFGEISTGKHYQQKILLKNLSKNGTIYKVLIPKQFENNIFSIPKSGSISGQELSEIVFKVTSNKVCNIDTKIQIIIRGSKNIELPLKASAILPSIRVENEEVDFGPTPVEGNPAQKQIILINDSPMAVDLELRLYNDTFLSKFLKLCPINDANLSLIETKEFKTYKAICLRVNPKIKTFFSLQFTPQTTEEYQFYLPLFLPNHEPLDELQKICRCKGIRNKLVAAEKEVNFGKIVIEQSQQIYSKSQIFQIRNPQEEAISWWVDETTLSPFRLDKCKGRLEGYQKVMIKVYFSAQTPGQYIRQIQFFIDQAETDISKCYLRITISASACYPALYFQQPYLILPTVRPGEESRGVLEIINGGYENINLRHSISQEYSSIDLKVSYPNGSNLGVTKRQIKVEISFVSDRPVSFTIKLNFHDSSNRIFTINVSGTADTHTYTLLEAEKNQSSVDRSCNFMKYYLNNTGHLHQELYEFPLSLADNDFQKLAMFLGGYSPSFDKIRSQLKKNKTFIAFQYISEVIKLLKAEGAFLNHIRPEMLLTYDDYIENIKIRVEDNPTALGYYRLKDKGAFDLQQRFSWLVLFYQIFKIFSRVNPGKLKPNCEFWFKFNVKQKMLLSWLQKSYSSESGIQLAYKSNEVLSSLNNGEVFSSLISKYTNIKVLECYGKIAKNQKEKEKRCRQVIDTFTQIGINCLLRVEDLLRCSEKQMLLITQNLFLILPSYLQKGEPIVFSCQFGQIVTKSVEITNPSKFPITYVAKVEGSRAYVVQGESQFVIQSKKTQQIRIKYISNINMNNSSATLTLTGKPNIKFTPSTFVFVLKSNNLGRISEKSIQVTANLYEQLDFTVKTANNFMSDGEFKVELQNSPKNIYNSFYMLNNTVKIKKGETASINLTFLPFTLETQQATLIFRDEKVGEFQYDLVGLVECNVMCQEVLRISQQLYTNKKYQIELQIPTKNDLIIKARKAAEYLVDKIEKKLGTQKDQKVPINYQKYYPKFTACQNFSAKLTTPNNSIILRTEQLIIKDIEAGDDPSKKQDQKLLFDINLKSPIKEGSFTINIKNASGTDNRKYKVTLSAVARPLRYQLELKIPVNKVITQPLPLINITNDKNSYQISLIAANDASKGSFSIDCEREVIVDAKEQSLVNLNFKPKTQTTCSALLKMQNLTTGQSIQYQVIGVGEEPEAEVIQLEQEVRKQKNYSIKLPFIKSTKINILNFTLENAQYQKSMLITPQNPSFKFKLTPKLSGKYEAKLLIEADQALLAYKLVITVKSMIQGEIKLRTIERKQVWTELALPKGAYTIKNNDYNLRCPKQIIITDQSSTVSLGYYSSKPEEKQILVTFLNDTLGQMCYIIKVIVEAMPQTKLEPFQVQLGKTYKQKINFQNTDDCPITITSHSSHPNIFFSQFQTLKIQPRSQIQAFIIYRASSLEIQEGKVYFTSDKNAKWIYHLGGYGLPQAKAELKVITVNVGEQVCESITFRNPLNKTLPFSITLQTEENNSPFSTILKSSKIDLAYNQELQIPVTVQPTSVKQYRAILKIMLNDKVSWRYELIARTISKCCEQVKIFKCCSRIKCDQTIQFPLPFSQQYSGKCVKLAIKPLGDTTQSVIKGIIKIQTVQSMVSKEKVAYQLSILSFKPRNLQSVFEISTDDGCQWIFRCDFLCLAPPLDDKFEIVAAINKPASVKFRLTNRLKSYSKYNAYFTSDSCIDFTVSPKNGQLEPYGRQGTPIQVIFCPTQYKKNWVGRLIIQTEESYWSYEVKGSLPHYNPPKGRSNLKQ